MATNFAWNAEKDDWLVEQREISFREVADAIGEGHAVALLPHHNQQRYPGQRIYYVEVRRYIYMVPFVTEPDGTRFLKTIIPSSEATRYYLGGRR
jgi:hypothetical protein